MMIMIMMSGKQLLLTILVLWISSSCSAWVTPSSRSAALTAMYGSAATNNDDQNDNFVGAATVGAAVNARQARILAPLSSIALLLGSTTPSQALQGKGPFDEQLKEHFPGALTSSVIALRVVAALKKGDYKPYNLLMASSVPAGDETLTTPTSLIYSLQSQLANKKSGGVCALGGLGGLPLAGTGAMKALLSHAPNKEPGTGKVLLIFGPNVGITESGKLGKLVRSNMETETDAGVIMGLLSSTTTTTGFDYQQEYVKKRVTEMVGASTISAAAAAAASSYDNTAVAKVTKALYDLNKELLELEIQQAIAASPGFWKDIQQITLMGGIFINRNEKWGEDCFQPLTMKTLTQSGESTDLYDQAFGDLPTPRNRVK